MRYLMYADSAEALKRVSAIGRVVYRSHRTNLIGVETDRDALGALQAVEGVRDVRPERLDGLLPLTRVPE